MNQNQLKSLADQHGQDLADKKAKDDRRMQGWQLAKRGTWAILLAGAFLMYYLIDKLIEALSILR